MNINIKPIEMKVVNITSPRLIVETWVKSRPWFLSFVTENNVEYVYDKTNDSKTPVPEYFEDLLKQDMAYMYFSNVILECRTSLLLRDFFYQFQFEGKWATTNRYVAPSEVYASSEAVTDMKAESEVYQGYMNALKRFHSGEIKDLDVARKFMPLSFQTPWQICLPTKLLMRIIGYMFQVFGVCDFTTSVWAALAANEELHPYLSMIAKYSHYEDPRFPSVKPEKETSSDNETVTWRKKIGYTLFTHMIRHEGVQVGGYTDFLKRYINNKVSTYDRTTRAVFNVSFKVNKKRWIEILKIRTAWFALVRDFNDCNSWGWILGDYLNGNLEHDKKYLKYFDTETGEFLPSQVHAYAMDEDLKVRKNSRGQLPDAFALESKAILLQRIKEQGTNPLLEDYLQMFEQGYIKDNPDNLLRKRWESYQ